MKKENEKIFSKKRAKNNKGITLIILIITIIIMMVLAGVSISGFTGKNALLNKTRYATNEYEEKGKNRAEQLNEFTKSFSNEDEGEEIDNNFNEIMNETIPF